METNEIAREVLDTMLGYLGFVAEVELDTTRDDCSIQVLTGQPELLIGTRGERLDDIQYLVNRIVQTQHRDSPRIRVDVDHHREAQEQNLLEEAEHLAERVVHSGEPAKMPPLNSYHRRLVHTHFTQHPQVQTWSPSDSSRLKRITFSLRQNKD